MKPLFFAAMSLCIIADAQQIKPQPISVGIVFDTSGTMGTKLKYSRQVVDQFLKTAIPEDEFFLVKSSDHPAVVSSLTADTDNVENRLTFVQSSGRSALFDAIYMALNELRSAANSRKFILVISDGANNSSRYANVEIENAARDAGVRIYTVGVFESLGVRARSREELSGPSLLNDLSEHTGAKQFTVDTSLGILPDVGFDAATEMRAPR